MGKQSRKASKAKGLHAAASPSAGEPDLSALMGALGMGGASGASGQAPGMQQLAQLMQMLQGMEGMGPGDDLVSGCQGKELDSLIQRISVFQEYSS